MFFQPLHPHPDPNRAHLYEIIFESDTGPGKTFDVTLLILIVISVLAVIGESVERWVVDYGEPLRILEWVLTILFTLEYGLRLWCVREPKQYAVSFFGLVDLLSILPTYLSLVLTGTQFLLVIRVLRLLRVFRVLKMARFLGAADVLLQAIMASMPKITVFVFTVVPVIVIMGTTMYLIEGPESGFDNILIGMYWTVVTLTTVGYGDVVPITPLGKFLSSVLMMMGYGIIAVPTGIMSVEIAAATRHHMEEHVAAQGKEGEEHTPQGEELFSEWKDFLPHSPGSSSIPSEQPEDYTWGDGI